MLSAHSWRACAGTGWADSSQWEVANSRSARECTSILGSGSTGRSALTLPRSASSKWALACISASTLTPSLYAQCPGDYLNGRKLRSALEVTAGTGRRVLLHGNGGYMPSSSGPALTGGRGSSSRPRGGVISGYAFRVIREQLGHTQEAIAEQLRVSPDTIAGWESGRRPSTAVPVGQMLVHRHLLMQLGTAPPLLQTLERAMEADVLLASALDEQTAVEASPLGAWVMQRDLVEVLAWPFNGVPPQPIRALPVPPRPRRGPAPSGPELSLSDRRQFFARMRRTSRTGPQRRAVPAPPPGPVSLRLRPPGRYSRLACTPTEH